MDKDRRIARLEYLLDELAAGREVNINGEDGYYGLLYSKKNNESAAKYLERFLTEEIERIGEEIDVVRLKSRLEEIGELIEKLPSGYIVSKSRHTGEWFVTNSNIRSKDLLEVLKGVDNG